MKTFFPHLAVLALVSLLTTFATQLLERRLFFMSGAAPRMPGVPMPD